MLSLSIMSYGIESLISSDGGFVALTVLTRVMEGVGATMALTAFISLLPKVYPKERGRAYSARYCGTTFGSALGMAIVSISFSFGNILAMFLSIGAICSFGVCLLYYFPENKE